MKSPFESKRRSSNREIALLAARTLKVTPRLNCVSEASREKMAAYCAVTGQVVTGMELEVSQSRIC